MFEQISDGPVPGASVYDGHDHSYLRTKKMKNNRPVSEGVDGTIYVTSTATEKYYKFRPLSEAEVQFGNTLTYQAISVSEDEHGAAYLTFKTFDREHNLKDILHINASVGMTGSQVRVGSLPAAVCW